MISHYYSFLSYQELKKMGKVYSRLTLPFRSFNIHGRTNKVLSREKPIPAPQYPSVSKQKELVDKLHPNFLEKHNTKDKQLDENLKNVYVVSKDPQNIPETDKDISTKPLPQRHVYADTFEFGFYEPDAVPEGKCSLKQALTFIAKHRENSVEYSVERIALEYKLDKQVTANILEHFLVPKMVPGNTSNEPSKGAQKVIKD